VTFTGNNVVDYSSGLQLAVTNNGTITIYVLIEEVPS
jgi:hypothetical protein